MENKEKKNILYILKKNFSIIYIPLLLLRHLFRVRKYRFLKKFYNQFDINILAQSNHLKLFILGSGSSINEIDKDTWKHISENFSIGFNRWVFHDFIPNFYSLELGKEDKENEIVYERFIVKHKSYSKTKILLKNPHQVMMDNLMASKLNLIYSIPYEIPGVTISQFKKGLKFYKFLIKHKMISKSSLITKRASVAMLIMMGWQAGFKEIVLCGIDLVDNRYFFEEYDHIPRLPKTGQELNRQHSTLHSEYSDLGVLEVIETINEILLIPDGCSLTYISVKSALDKILSHY